MFDALWIRSRSAWAPYLAPLLVWSCGDSKASDERSGAACMLPQSFTAGACDTCLAGSCCEPIEACSSDASCAAVMSCVWSCIDGNDQTSCTAGCFESTPPPESLDAALECLFVECPDQCVPPT